MILLSLKNSFTKEETLFLLKIWKDTKKIAIIIPNIKAKIIEMFENNVIIKSWLLKLIFKKFEIK